MSPAPSHFDRFDEARSKYGVEIRETPSGTAIIVLDELPGQRGATVAAVFEHLATELYRNYLQDRPAWSLVWVLRHPARGTVPDPTEETCEQVLLEWDGHHFRSPKRIPLPRDSWQAYGFVKD